MSRIEKSTLEIIRQQICELLRNEYDEQISRATLIKEVLDSMLFIGLLVRVETYFNIEISDQTIYESGIVNIGDLVDCIQSQQIINQSNMIGELTGDLESE
ncbi:phosphopantetheine-binding protein [Porticoccaceae bacterium]|nr:phosphopantetheine-binding protein [Porticoccaceae bacterium]